MLLFHIACHLIVCATVSGEGNGGYLYRVAHSGLYALRPAVAVSSSLVAKTGGCVIIVKEWKSLTPACPISLSKHPQKHCGVYIYRLRGYRVHTADPAFF